MDDQESSSCKGNCRRSHIECQPQNDFCCFEALTGRPLQYLLNCKVFVLILYEIPMLPRPRCRVWHLGTEIFNCHFFDQIVRSSRPFYKVALSKISRTIIYSLTPSVKSLTVIFLSNNCSRSFTNKRNKRGPSYQNEP